MNECKADKYKTNTVVTHSPLVCFGGYSNPTCEYLFNCLRENKVSERKINNLKKKLNKV